MHLRAFFIVTLGIILEVVAFNIYPSNQNSQNQCQSRASHQRVSGRYVSLGHDPWQQRLAQPPRRIHRESHVSISLKSRMPGRNDTGPKNRSTARNEFSRTLQFYGNGAPVRKRPLDLSISATQAEREALAKRFRLSEIASLSADLTVQPAIGFSSTADGGNHIDAIGKVSARVTQNCVRTNDEFEVDLEFDFDMVLKAMTATMDPGGSNEVELSAGEQAALEAASSLGGSRRPNKGKRRKGVRGGESSKDLDEMGMKQVQNILQDFEVTDDILEDEACFCTDGIVDVGEIVSQIFRSNLDPYPKKPGSVSDSCQFIFPSSCESFLHFPYPFE